MNPPTITEEEARVLLDLDPDELRAAVQRIADETQKAVDEVIALIDAAAEEED